MSALPTIRGSSAAVTAAAGSRTAPQSSLGLSAASERPWRVTRRSVVTHLAEQGLLLLSQMASYPGKRSLAVI